MSGSALEGIRVIDCSMWFAGPFATQLLAHMGAEVIKVESVQAMDGWRGGLANPEAGKIWEASPAYNSVNHNKYDLTLNLNDPKGADIFKRLVAVGDVVVENYTPRVMKNFGLHYEALREVNPALIMLSMPGYGGTGPWKDYVAFAFLVEEIAGVPQLTGYPGGPPMLMGASQADAIGGYNGAFAVLTALEYRRKTGQGQCIDLSQVEALTCLMAEPILDYGMNKRIWPRRGNRHRSMAPHGCYRCKGEDQWVTLAVADDAQWARFCKVVGRQAWRDDERFATSLARWENQEALDPLIEQWTMEHTAPEVMVLLQGAGIAAGPVLSHEELLADPHLKERDFYETMDREEVGRHPYPGVFAKLSKTPGRLHRPSPTLGQDNEYVLGELLGMSEEEMAQLAKDHVIGKGPLLEHSKRSI